MWRRSIDIRRALPGNARADPESRPEHSTPFPAAGGPPFDDPNTTHTSLAPGVDANSTPFTPMGKARGHAGDAATLIEKIYA